VEDKIVASAVIDPKLNTPFFRKTETSLPWHIVVHDDGTLEDAIDDTIDAEDLVRVEHTAHCVSTHRGEHSMAFSEAVAREEGVILTISGGLPAYTGELTVSIDGKGQYECAFTAEPKVPTPAFKWKIKNKALRLRSDKMKPGSRLYGWISVEFEETDGTANTARTYKIEGHFKPVIQSPAANIKND
jgi:hypothetical protein